MKGILLLAVIHLFIIYQSQKKKSDIPPSYNAMEAVAKAGSISTKPLFINPLFISQTQPAIVLRTALAHRPK